MEAFASGDKTAGMSVDEKALAEFSRQRDLLFEKIRVGSRSDVLALACPACGGPLAVFWMRQLIPIVGCDALNVRCSDERCTFSIQADGEIPRPAWAGFFSGTLTTTPATLVRPKISGGN